MNKGTVKFYNDSKGFGFIIDDDKNTEHFVHVSGLIDVISEDDVVEFELQEGKRGLNAVNVQVIAAPAKVRDKVSGENNCLSLYFNLDEYSPEEISKIISTLSDIYSIIGGDEIIIKGMQQLQYIEFLEPELI
ncbi:MAG: hypothetical protein GQ574_24810 [Crocinitomix sp.]|nr:hypothetical protein [Crocinitomix sp.]